MTKMTLLKIKQLAGADSISVLHGIYTVRKGFFYKFGRTEKDLIKKICENIPKAFILESGEVFKPFVGGASIAKQSHWFVKFGIDD